MATAFEEWWDFFLSSQGDPDDCAFAFDAQTLAQEAWNAALVYPSRLPIPVSANYEEKEITMEELRIETHYPDDYRAPVDPVSAPPDPKRVPSPVASTDEQGNDGAEQGNDGGEQGS